VFKYSVVLGTLKTAGCDVWEKPREVLQMVADAGYDGVDIDAEPDRTDRRRFDEVVDIAQSVGLQVAGLLGAWGVWHAGEERDLASGNEEARAYAVSYTHKCIDLSASVGGPVFEICVVPFEAEFPVCSTPLEVLRRNFVRSAREIAEYAAQRDVLVAIEPINRFEGYAGFINSVSDAMSVVDEIQVDSLGVMADLFHVNIEDVSPAHALRRAGRSLMHIHLADNNRQAPGTGHIDFPNLIRTLDDIGYDGYLALDCLPVQPDAETLLQRSIAYMKELERMHLLQRRLYSTAPVNT
jgi:sugar phosphate isomerase/epimerase